MEARTFSVVIEGKPAGEFRITMRTQEDGVQQVVAENVTQSKVGATWRRVAYSGVETWKGGRLQKFEGRSYDDGKRRQMYRDMQLMLHEGSGVGIPTFISGLDAHIDKLKGLKPMGTGSMMGYAFGEHVWLDA